MYHIDNLKVETAVRLWKDWVRDIDVNDKDGLTPLILLRSDSRDLFIEGLFLVDSEGGQSSSIVV